MLKTRETNRKKLAETEKRDAGEHDGAGLTDPAGLGAREPRSGSRGVERRILDAHDGARRHGEVEGRAAPGQTRTWPGLAGPARRDVGGQVSGSAAPTTSASSERLQVELVKCQEWIKARGLEGRDPLRGARCRRQGRRDQDHDPLAEPALRAGRGAARAVRARALPVVFQRYAAHLPAAGEMVLFDRSWYNRAGVERVMGFCTDDEYEEFMRSCPEFERMLVRSGIMLVKYWFSVSDDEQERRSRLASTIPPSAGS